MSTASRSGRTIAGRDVDQMAKMVITSPSIAHISHSGLTSAVYWAVRSVAAYASALLERPVWTRI
jgi:hypothetical protein